MRAIVAFAILLFALPALAETPKLIGRVNDHAAVLTVNERASLERKLEAIEQTDGHPQVAVLLPTDMGGLDIERFANDTYRAWKLGRAGKDNGILIVIAPKERKWRIEVGYGLEGVIPDGRAKAIIASAMDPHLKGGKTGFYAALDAAITAIGAELAKERSAGSGNGFETIDSLWLIPIMLIGTGFCLLLMILHGRQSEREEQEKESLRRSIADERRRAAQRREANAMGIAAVGASIGGGVGASVAAAALSRRRQEEAKPREREEPSRSSGYSSDSGSSSSSSYSGSSDSGSSSFSGGGGDSGGGGASGGD